MQTTANSASLRNFASIIAQPGRPAKGILAYLALGHSARPRYVTGEYLECRAKWRIPNPPSGAYRRGVRLVYCNEVNARAGKHIMADHAIHLVEHAQNVITALGG